MLKSRSWVRRRPPAPVTHSSSSPWKAALTRTSSCRLWKSQTKTVGTRLPLPSVQKLDANPAALGIFGFSFLDQNRDKVMGSTVGGVEPTFDNIAAGDYGISRSLFFYVKKEHVGVIPGIEEFVAEFTDEDTWGSEGYLTDKGLIPLPDEAREQSAVAARNLTPLEGL